MTGRAENIEVFAVLKGHQYMNLTTYRKTGEAVTTPVWFVLENDTVYGMSQPQTGKIKRIRRNPKITLAPSTGAGKPLGPQVEGRARLLSLEEGAVAETALKRKYGWQFSLFDLLMKVRKIRRVFWQISAV